MANTKLGNSTNDITSGTLYNATANGGRDRVKLAKQKMRQKNLRG